MRALLALLTGACVALGLVAPTLWEAGVAAVSALVLLKLAGWR